MTNVYIKLKKRKVHRTTDLDKQVLLDRDEDGSIVGVELLNVKGIEVNGKKINI